MSPSTAPTRIVSARAAAFVTALPCIPARRPRLLTAPSPLSPHPLDLPNRRACRPAISTADNHRARRYSTAAPTAMVATTGVPGVLDTDPAGSVLLSPRDGAVAVTFDADLAAHETPLLVLAVWASEEDSATNGDADAPPPKYVLPPSLDVLPADVRAALDDMAADAEFSAKTGSSTDVLRMPSNVPYRRVVLYGLGKKSAEASASAAAGAAEFAVGKGMGINKCASVSLFIDAAAEAEVTAAGEGAVVGGYVDERYKEKSDSGKVPATLVLAGLAETPSLAAAAARGRTIANGINTTRDLVNAPANCLTPATMAAAAEEVAKECGLGIKVLGRAECEELGMGSYLGVGRGSTDEPKFIHMWYTPEGGASKKVCVIGKSVTFDTGGSNLKVGAGSSIELMKFDMGGGATTIGTAKTVGDLKPKGIEVHFIMPAVENMLSDRAIHPGDILKASNGKTVEVLNTDAEGRLCLADALVYAEKLGDVDYMVDIATLTGAIVVSLGNDVAGMWSKSDAFADELLASAKATGEKLWRMPLVDSYAEQLKSKIADLRNIGTGRAGGSITAALFLREFVKMDNWAHIDIAGTVWADKRKGATGYGVKTLTHWVESLAQ